ncbi:MAG: hypothetical protein ACLQHS_01875 [Candidatus Limnocylindrales bacterium]
MNDVTDAMPAAWTRYVPVDVPLVTRILDAAAHAAPAKPGAARIMAVANNAFTGDCEGWGGCGHYHEWRDTLAWFHQVDDIEAQWCPACLPEELRRGDVVLEDTRELAWLLASEQTGRDWLTLHSRGNPSRRLNDRR